MGSWEAPGAAHRRIADAGAQAGAVGLFDRVLCWGGRRPSSGGCDRACVESLVSALDDNDLPWSSISAFGALESCRAFLQHAQLAQRFRWLLASFCRARGRPEWMDCCETAVVVLTCSFGLAVVALALAVVLVGDRLAS